MKAICETESMAPQDFPKLFEWNPASVVVLNDRTVIKSEEAQARITSFALDRGNLILANQPSSELALFQAFAAIRSSKAFCITDGEPAFPELRDLAGKFITQTSGTTSEPRLILRSQASWIASFSALPKGTSVSENDNVAVCGELVHSLSLYAAIEAIHNGATLHLINEISARKQLAEIAARKISVIYATPTQLRLIAFGAEQNQKPCTSVTRVFVGGSKLDSGTRETTQSLFPDAEIFEFYGASETSFISITGSDTPPNFAGKAFPNVEIQVRDQNGGQVEAGVEGEIWVRSPYLFEGYASGDASSTRFDGGYLTIGEKGYLDSDGNLFVGNRIDRMAIIADQNVFLEALEDSLRTIESVVDAAVIPQTDTTRGHRLVAAVCCDNQAANEKDLLLRAKELLGPLKSPKKLTILREWPVLKSGKTDYREIEAILNRDNA